VTGLAADVAVAVDLIDRAEVANWPRLTEGLMHTPPRIHERDVEWMQEIADWLAPYAYSQPSMVRAAVANFARVLADLMLVTDYDVTLDTRIYRVAKWYRREPGSPQAVEDWEIHVRLIHNLTVELTRALNLVIARTQQADPLVLPNQPLAVCEVDPGPARLQPVAYTTQQSEEPQPYPGLVGFPAVIHDRTVGHLGLREGSVERTPAEFEGWITFLINRRGKGSAPPPLGMPPFALAPPVPPKDTSLRPATSLAIFLAVLTAFAAFGSLIPHPWLVGSAIVAGLSAVVLQSSVWKWPPDLPALLLAAMLTAVGGVAGELVSAALAGGGKPTVSAVRQGTHTPPATSFQPVGQLEQGDWFRGGIGSVKGFKDPVVVPVGRALRLGVRLRNGGPDELPVATVKITVPNVAAPSESVGATVRSNAAKPPEVADTMTVIFDGGQSACLHYVSGSTLFLDSRHGVIRSLPNTAITSGVTVGSIGVLSTEARYVVFSLTSTSAIAGTGCN
jgi:hypothetical protein